MAIWSKMGLSGPAAGAGAALIFVMGAGGYGIYSSLPDDPPSAAASAPKATAEPAAEPKPEAVEDVAAPQVPAGPERPAFDVVQVQSDGSGVLAGRAVPGRPVVFYLDGEEFSRAQADGSGKFGAVLDFPASDAPRSLSMASVLEDGQELASEGTLLISPVRRAEPEVVAEAEPEVVKEEASPEIEVAAQETVDSEAQVEVAETEAEAREVEATEEIAAVVEDTPNVVEEVVAAVEPEVAPAVATENPAQPQAEEVAEEAPADPQPEPVQTEVAETPVAVVPEIEPVAPAQPAAEPDAPAVVLATNDSVKVIQPAPRPEAPQLDDSPVVANVVIDTITYDSSGDVALTGRGVSDGFVRVYLNDKPIKTSRIAEDGSWEAPLPDVDAGVYRLRIDEVASDGAVTSRVETPFQREEPEIAASAKPGPQAVIVQPGFTLWAIARDNFGSGEQYVRVYEANRDLIRNPDLIYPGQVFALPEG